jgi:transposase
MKPFGKLSRHVQAVSYSATLLFHSIPAVTDGLLRLPPGDPVLQSIEDPLLKMCYLGLLALFLVGVSLQLRWIRRQPV